MKLPKEILVKSNSMDNEFYEACDMATTQLYASTFTDNIVDSRDLLNFLLNNPHLCEMALSNKKFKDMNGVII